MLFEDFKVLKKAFSGDIAIFLHTILRKIFQFFHMENC